MPHTIAWVCLLLAIITEVAGMTSMKLSQGFTQMIPSLGIFIFYAFSFFFLRASLKQLDIGFAYAVWSGLGTFFIFIIGIYFFAEPVTTLKTISLISIIAGVIGLKQA